MHPDDLAARGQAALENNREQEASDYFAQALRCDWNHPQATLGVEELAQRYFVRAIKAEDNGYVDLAIAAIVESIQLNPNSGELREKWSALMAKREQPQGLTDEDLTEKCFIFPDGERAARFYRDAIQRAFDFIVFGGVDGDVYEFGMLAGWTARHLAEEMRDRRYLATLRLFDSFDGLPPKKGHVDLQSYDVRRCIWRDNMAFSDDFIRELGEPIDSHIARNLQSVLSAERLKIVRGFFSDTLRTNLGSKAALVHLDCDFYSSTIEVLNGLASGGILQDGTVLLFDDWNCNKANPNFGQRRAFHEFLEREKGQFSASHFFNYGYNCACFILHDMRLGF